MRLLRAVFALIAWLAIWVPTTLFVVFVLVRDLIRERQSQRARYRLSGGREAGADA